MTTWNPSDKHADITLSNGDMTATLTVSGWKSVRATSGLATGKRYFEILINAINVSQYLILGVGNVSAGLTTYVGGDANGYGYYATNGKKVYNTAQTAYGATFTTNDVIGVALDMDNGKIWFAKNGVWQASGDPAAGSNPAFTGLSGTLLPMLSPNAANDAATIRTDISTCTYTPPSGFDFWDGNLEILEDASLDLSAYYQKLENLLSALGATDGTTLKDLAAYLRAHDGLEFRELRMMLQTISSLDVFAHISAITGAGSPNYLDEPRGIVVSGNYAYVVSFGDDALTIFDISDPTAPVHVGAITGQGSPNYLYGASCIAKAGSYVYIASYHDDALTIFDVSNPASPTLVGSYVETPDPYYLQNAVAIAVEGNYAYVLGQAHADLAIIDISDPAAPTLVGTMAGAGSPNYLGGACSVVISGNYAYIVSTSDNALTIFDISDPENPVHVGAITGAGSPNYLGYPVNIVVEGNYAYVICTQSLGVGDNALTIFDISDPENPVHIGEYAEPAYPTPSTYLKQPRGLKIYGNYAFIASYGGTFSVIDITNPAAPVHADTIEGSGSPYYLGGARAIDVQDGIAGIVSETSSALTIFNVSKFTGISTYQKMDYLRMALEVLAEDPSEYRDIIMQLEAWGVNTVEFSALLEAVKYKYKDIIMQLEATDGTLLDNFIAALEATDGTVLNNFIMELNTIAATPVFRSVIAHRVTSVAHEVA